MSVRLRFTMIVEYDADPEEYMGDDCDGTPEAMAALDQKSLDLGEMSPLDFLEGGHTASITVEVA